MKKVFFSVTNSVVFAAIFLPFIVLAESVEIKMTQDGFMPNELEIQKDTEVIFINEDNVSRWPASDIHPTHLIYPDFDPKKEIRPKESWKFKFEKSGNFKMHDHLLPHHRGIIKVTSEDSTSHESLLNKIQNQVSNFLNFLKGLLPKEKLDGEKFKSLGPDEQIEFLKKYAKQKGGEKTWEFLTSQFSEKEGSSGAVHDLAHLTGSLIYEDLGMDGIKYCTPTFAFGCFHGFLDQAFTSSLDKINLAEDACNALGIGGPSASCIHGIGHGVASFHQTANLEDALVDCERLRDGIGYCYDGVFMEFVRNAAPNFYKVSDPLFPCNSLDQKFQFACGRNQPPLLMGRFGTGFPEVISTCIKSDSDPFKDGCFDSIGFSLAASGDVQTIISGCKKIGDDIYIKRCTNAAAGELIFQNVANWDQKSKEICRSLPDASECTGYTERIISDYNR